MPRSDGFWQLMWKIEQRRDLSNAKTSEFEPWECAPPWQRAGLAIAAVGVGDLTSSSSFRLARSVSSSARTILFSPDICSARLAAV